MKETKYRLETFSIYDRTGLERHLARMAEEGWLLEKIGQFLWTYRRIEPKTLTFSVCYFPKASQFDPGPSEEQETFYDFCAHTGWTLAAANAQLQVFYNERPCPTPIETDPVMELDAIHRTMKRGFLPYQLMLLVVALMNSALLIWRLFQDPVEVLASPDTLFIVGCWTLVFLLIGVECGGYFLWRSKAVRAAERGEYLETHSHRGLQVGSLVLLAVGLVYYFLSIFVSGDRRMMVAMIVMVCIYPVVVFLTINGIRGFLKRKKVSAAVNRVVTFVSAFAVAFIVVAGITFGVLYGGVHGWFQRDTADEETYEAMGHTWTARHDELPLTVEDLTGEDYGDAYSYERQLEDGSLFLGRSVISQSPRFDAEGRRDLPRLDYTIVEVRAPFLYDLCRDSFLDQWEDDEIWDRAYVPVEAAPWGAVEAFQEDDAELGRSNQYLLCYPDHIVEIWFNYDWDVGPEQMAVVGERLGG